MASDKDVLGKADALLRRHAVGTPASGIDTGGVPVLTELVGDPGQPAPAPPPPTPAVELSSSVAQEVFNRVLADVEQRLAADLEKRLCDNLTPQIHAAVAEAMGGLRREIAHTVATAVADALARRPVK